MRIASGSARTQFPTMILRILFIERILFQVSGFLIHNDRSMAIRHTASKDVRMAIPWIIRNSKLNRLVIFPVASIAMDRQNPLAPTKKSDIARLVTWQVILLRFQSVQVLQITIKNVPFKMNETAHKTVRTKYGISSIVDMINNLWKGKHSNS